MRRLFAAPADRLFAAWTNPEQLSQWWGPPGSSVHSVEVDLREGGRYRIGIKQPNDQIYFVYGIYTEIKRPEKLAFTWRWEQPEMDFGDSLVDIRFEAQASSNDVSTAVTLTHSQLPDENIRTAHREGWEGILQNLSGYLSGVQKKTAPTSG